MITYKVQEIYKNNLTDNKLKEIINKKLYKIIELMELNVIIILVISLTLKLIIIF